MPPPLTKSKTSQVHKTHKTHHSSAPMINPKRSGKTYRLKQPDDATMKTSISRQLDLKGMYSSLKPDRPSV